MKYTVDQQALDLIMKMNACPWFITNRMAGDCCCKEWDRKTRSLVLVNPLCKTHGYTDTVDAPSQKEQNEKDC